MYLSPSNCLPREFSDSFVSFSDQLSASRVLQRFFCTFVRAIVCRASHSAIFLYLSQSNCLPREFSDFSVSLSEQLLVSPFLQRSFCIFLRATVCAPETPRGAAMAFLRTQTESQCSAIFLHQPFANVCRPIRVVLQRHFHGQRQESCCMISFKLY